LRNNIYNINSIQFNSIRLDVQYLKLKFKKKEEESKLKEEVLLLLLLLKEIIFNYKFNEKKTKTK
jgi:hypothetical protein